jgi:CheY-like chemotaxis protein
MRILVVDDEPRYRTYVSAALRARGHEVAIAGGGREAIDVGLRFHPEILVTDWMLRNHMNGLHVSRVLAAVDQQMPTVLITGFPSRDLRREAKKARVVRFIDKPFELDAVTSAVDEAVATSRTHRSSVPFGVMIANARGLIVHTSARAQQMFARTEAGRRPGRLADLFDPEALARLAASTERWTRVRAIAPAPVQWRVRSKQTKEDRLFVLLPDRKSFLRHDPRVTSLLELPNPTASAGLPESYVLVLDDPRAERASYVEGLERLGCVCYRAETPALALSLLREEPRIGIVVIDLDLVPDVASLVSKLRGARPQVELIGASASLQRELDLPQVGITRLPQMGDEGPVRADEGNILPSRRARPAAKSKCRKTRSEFHSTVCTSADDSRNRLKCITFPCWNKPCRVGARPLGRGVECGFSSSPDASWWASS